MTDERALPTAEVVDGEQVSRNLRPLLLAIYRSLERFGGADEVADQMEMLLLFLSSPAGRTNANCVAADHFLCLRDGWAKFPGNIFHPSWPKYFRSQATPFMTQWRTRKLLKTSAALLNNCWIDYGARGVSGMPSNTSNT
jgi:hypothetical protein